MRAERACAVALIAALGWGCAQRLAPPGWSPTAREAQTEGYGGWIEVISSHGRTERATAGELLAISTDSVFVLADSSVVGCALTEVGQATLESYDPETNHAASWTIAGMGSTITHGWVLILSAPLWVLVGSTSTGVLSHQGRLERPRASWADMRLFARFPQGLPAGLDRAKLEPRPLHDRRVKRRYDPRSITN